ncbi:MAG TPA: hypothetical protein VK904_00075 [Miltoncostaeaceae bacterium]|nr:hypothetical protein [Miltoncostaeaceae bacterium]
MSPPPDQPRAAIAIREAPAAPAGSGDPTRRWALAFPDGATRFPGIARTESRAVLAALERVDPADWDRHLVEVSLPVVLSEGAGPHLLDVGGRLILALAAHPALPEERIAMGEAAPAHRIGLVRRVAGRLWRWTADAEIDPARRVEELDRLDAVADADGARRWQEEAGRAGG